MTLSPTSKRRLNRIADFAETIPRKQFDMNTFSANRTPDGEIVGCGFVGCVIGHAAQAKLFRGLRFDKDGEVGYQTAPGRPRHYGAKAAMALFGIDDDDVQWLFWPQHYENPTPKKVAKRVRIFIRKYAR